MFHPATLLLAWVAFLLVLPTLTSGELILLLLPVLAAAFLLARARAAAMLRRARWLLLSIALLFAFATPGVALSNFLGDAGITHEGLTLAAEHLTRLLLLLATLAVLHETLGTAGLLSGLHWILAPLQGWRNLRERIVVRLMLVIDFVESGQGSWRRWLGEDDVGPRSLALSVRPSGWRDALVLLLVGTGVAAVLA